MTQPPGVLPLPAPVLRGVGPFLINPLTRRRAITLTFGQFRYKRQRRNPAVTEIAKIPNRGHSLTIDHGWHQVAQTALDFLNRSAPPGHGPGYSAGTTPANAPESAP